MYASSSSPGGALSSPASDAIPFLRLLGKCPLIASNDLLPCVPLFPLPLLEMRLRTFERSEDDVDDAELPASGVEAVSASASWVGAPERGSAIVAVST